MRIPEDAAPPGGQAGGGEAFRRGRARREPARADAQREGTHPPTAASSGAIEARAAAIRDALRCGRSGCPCGRPGPRGMTHCAAHQDRWPSLSVAPGERCAVWYCHAGCSQDAVHAALKARGALPPPTPTQAELAPAGRGRGVTLDTLAAAKLLPVDFLKRLGLREHHPSVGVTHVVIPYRMPDGSEAFSRVRVSLNTEPRFLQPKNVPLMPYGLDRLEDARQAGWVLLVEGESDCWTAWYHGIPALGIPGKSAWRSDFAPALRGLQVYVWQEPGAEDFVQRIARDIPTCRIIAAPTVPRADGETITLKDLSETHLNGFDVRALIDELKASATPAPVAQAAGSTKTKGGERTGKPTQATLVVQHALARIAELFHTPLDEAFVTVPVGDHVETMPLRSRRARQWLARLAYETLDRSLSAQAAQEALTTLESRALFDGARRAVHVRIAGADAAIYLDLCDPKWRVVEITARGWRVIPAQEAPVRFWRPRGLLPLPEPARDGTVDELRRFLNVGSEADWQLIVGWLLAAFRPVGPHPILVLHGEQGSAKSTAARVLRALVDPNVAPLRAEPRALEDLVIAAANSWVQVFDNLSHLPAWLADALCRLSTGGGLAKRELYSDRDETLLDVQRPVILTGIEELATRSDLLDRSLLVSLPRIADAQRLPEEPFWRAFTAAGPRLLGALLGAVAVGLANLDRVQLDRYPRLADFALWVVACEPALPWPAGGFFDAFAGNRESAHELALEASPIVDPLRALLDAPASRGAWRGTATELLDALARHLPGGEREGKKPPTGWPANGRALSNALRRLAPNLRAVGIDVSFTRTAGRGSKRLIVVQRTAAPPSPPPPSPRPSPSAPPGGAAGDEEEKWADFAPRASHASHQVRTCDANSGGVRRKRAEECDANDRSAQVQGDACDACVAPLRAFSGSVAAPAPPTPRSTSTGPPCPRCGRQLHYGACWRCRDRLCDTCGQWTGRTARARCRACEEAAFAAGGSA